MTEQQGRGVRVLAQLVEDLSRINAEKARALFDGLTDAESGDVLAAHAAAVAATGERNIFVENIAERLDRPAPTSEQRRAQREEAKLEAALRRHDLIKTKGTKR